MGTTKATVDVGDPIRSISRARISSSVSEEADRASAAVGGTA